MRPTKRCLPVDFLAQTRRIVAALALGALALGLAAPGGAAPSGPPIRVGGSLALTGPLASTGMVHKLAGEIFVEQINKADGLLGRPVEWVLLDDQSKPDLTRTLYDRLVTADKVDLLIGPYATGSILSAMAVAERHGKMLIHNTFGIPKLAKYGMQFPVYQLGYTPEETFPPKLYDGLTASGASIKTIAIVTSKFPSVHFLSLGAREVAKKRGLTEVMYLEFEFGNRDFGAIAARVRDANPDLLWMGSIGLESNMLLEALKKLNYTPKNHFHLYPAPAPLAVAPEGERALAMTLFEPHPPFTNNPNAAEFVKVYRERAEKAKLPYPEADMQAALGYAQWQVLTAAVKATKSLDDKVLADWLRAHTVDTLLGRMRFNGTHNYGDDLSKVKQIQRGKWFTVWPKESAAPDIKFLVQ
ncbi:MAG: amino acid ABC transporter substrate-binding protein [Burkholderiales bacterium]|nr:amino acid ABC transporter substrate-binding protein [Burkholderiales bacterium]